jgi:ketosteroid isomerase-like protein
MIKQLIIVIALSTLISCNQTSGENSSAPAANVDSLTAIFVEGWNKSDSAAIMNTIAENCIVMNDSLIHKGHSAIANNWVSGGVKVLSNIRTSSVIKDSDSKIAYDAGAYTLDLTPPGGPLLKEKGNYSLVWTKQQDGNWKLTLVHIEDITRMPDIK